MSNERVEIEDLLVAVFEPLKTAGTVKTIMAVGGMDYEEALAAAGQSPPYIVIKYSGKDGELHGGGIHSFTARVSVVVGATHLGDKDKRRTRLYDILQAVEDLMLGKVIGAGYKPAWQASEDFVGIDTKTTVEMWEQIYVVDYQKG